MEQPVGVVGYINQENRKLKRFLFFILSAVGLSALVSGFLFTQITWVLGICFFYLLALEIILIYSTD